MKQFNLSQDAAYLVPALRSRGSSFAWPTTWRRKAGVVCAVLAAHVALLWLGMRMVLATPPESLPMAETEVILEQISADSRTPTPIPQQAKPPELAQASVPIATPQPQKIMREADMTETVKPVVPVKSSLVSEQVQSEPAPVAQQKTRALPTPVVDMAAKNPVPAPVSEAAKPNNNAKGAGVAFNPKPPYPKALSEAGVGGVVGLSIQVSAEGRASAVSVVRSSGQAVLDASARDTVLNRWKFKPARTASGDAVASTLMQSIRFVPLE